MEFAIECQRCLSCCRWPGEVRLDEGDVARMASFLGLNEQAFIANHTRLRKDRRGLALNEHPDHSCIFLVGNACAIQPVKPAQCSDFPNGWLNRLWGKVPLDVMRKDYPMLFACSAFKVFLKSQKS